MNRIESYKSTEALYETCQCSEKPVSASAELANQHLLKESEVPTILLSDITAIELDVSENEPATKTPATTAQRIFAWMTNSRFSLWGAKYLLKSGRMLITLGTPSNRTRRRMDEEIFQLSGSSQLAKAIHGIAPSLAEWLQVELITLGFYEGINAFLKEEHLTLKTTIETLLPVIYINIAKQIRAGQPENEKKTVQLVDVVNYLCNIFDERLFSIQDRIQEIEKITDLVRRERRLDLLYIEFQPLAKDLLAAMFSRGAKDLPFWPPLLTDLVWSKLQNQIVPQLLLDLHKQLYEPFKPEKKDALLKIPGGNSFVSLAKLAGERAAILLPTLFEETAPSSKSIVTQSIIEALAAYAPSIDERQKEWLADQISAFGSSQKKSLNRLWTLLGSYAQPFLIHVFYHLSLVNIPENELKGLIPDALGIVAIRFFSLCSRFFNQHQEEIESRIALLKHKGDDPYKDEILLQQFSILADSLLVAMGLNKTENIPLPNFLKEVVGRQLRDMAPGFLLRQYFAIKNNHIDNDPTGKKLRKLFFDVRSLINPDISTKVMPALHTIREKSDANDFVDSYDKILWKESGTEPLVDTIESICSVISRDFVDSIFLSFGVGFQTALKEENNPFMKRSIVYFKELTEAAILKAFANIVATTKEKVVAGEPMHPKQLLLVNFLLQMVELSGKGLVDIQKKIKDAKLKQTPEQAFAMLAEEIHAFAGPNPLIHLPLEGLPESDLMKELLWGVIKDSLLPDYLLKTYNETVVWKDQKTQSIEDLDRCYRTTHPKWTCHVLAQYVSDYLRNYLVKSNTQSAKALLVSLESYFKSSHDPKGNPLALKLRERGLITETVISDTLYTFGKYEGEQTEIFWPVLTELIEGAILKFFAEFSKTLRDLEKDNPYLMVDIAILMLKDTVEYFKVVTRAAEDFVDEKTNQIDLKQLFASFGTRLHDGVPLDPNASEEDKERIRLEGCFIPMAAKIFELANMSINDLPFPSSVKQQLGELFMEQLLPQALMSATQSLSSPEMRDSLMLSFIQQLYKELNAIELQSREMAVEEAKVTPDPKQKLLIEICGAVVLEIVKLIPDTMVQYVFKKEEIKNMSAEVIGMAMMPYLSQETMREKIDQVIEAALPSIHLGEWKGSGENRMFVPLKQVKGVNGNEEARDVVKKLKFIFAQKDHVKSRENDHIVHMKLRDAFTQTISSQLKVKIWDFIKDLWIKLHREMDALISRQFPSTGLKIKTTLDKIFHQIFFNFIGTVVSHFSSLFIGWIQMFVEKFYINKRSDEIIKNLHSETIEHLVYKWMDDIFDTLVRLQKDMKLAHE